MELSLVATRGTVRGKIIPVSGHEFSIGRDPQCDLYLPSPIVSRRHAMLLIRDGKVLLRDLASRNGTFVNGQLVRGECEIRADDSLQVGLSEYRVQLGSPEESTEVLRAEDLAALDAPTCPRPAFPAEKAPAPPELSWRTSSSCP